MFKFTRRLAATAFLLGASTQAIAGSEGWSVSEASGSVFLQHDGKRVIAKRGASVQAGDSIVTGQGDRRCTVRGRDELVEDLTTVVGPGDLTDRPLLPGRGNTGVVSAGRVSAAQRGSVVCRQSR